MATLYTRLTQNTAPPGGDNNRLNPHKFPWSMVLAAKGSPTIDREYILSVFDLDDDATAQLDSIIAKYVAKNNIQKLFYLATFEPTCGMAFDGSYTEAQFNAEFEI